MLCEVVLSVEHYMMGILYVILRRNNEKREVKRYLARRGKVIQKEGEAIGSCLNSKQHCGGFRD